MADRETISFELAQLSLVYRGAKIGKAELDELLEVWAQDLDDVYSDEFQQAVREHRRTNDFFPTVAAIRKKVDEIRNRPQNPDRVALPGQPKNMTEEEREKNQRWARYIRETLVNKKGNW